MKTDTLLLEIAHKAFKPTKEVYVYDAATKTKIPVSDITEDSDGNVLIVICNDEETDLTNIK